MGHAVMVECAALQSGDLSAKAEADGTKTLCQPRSSGLNSWEMVGGERNESEDLWVHHSVGYVASS